ncbi:MAG: nicotinate (nicotinamide) nucleotide adenylyltransferase [Oscillospiraceae bacterium]
MKIGVFGGSFNPIHIGHIKLATFAKEKLGLDKLIIVPVGNPCHKESSNLIDGKDRINMCKLAFEGYNNIEVCPFEVERTEQSYTSTTIHMLKVQYPDDEFFLIMGSDMFLHFDKWHCYEELKDMVTVCVGARTSDVIDPIVEFSEKLKEDGCRTIVFNGGIFEVSSTEIRDSFNKHYLEQMSSLIVPIKVIEYIVQNGLYGCDKIAYEYDFEFYSEKVKEMVDEKRYIHSLAVSKRAVYLAQIYGCDTNKAKVAGIVHDICKSMTYDEMLHWIKKSDIIWDNATLAQESILHGIAACEYIKSELRIYNTDITQAVMWHTTGKANMSLFEKLIFVADLTSEDRTYPDFENIRKISEENLDEAVEEILRFNLKKILEKANPISLATAQTYNFYCVK